MMGRSACCNLYFMPLDPGTCVYVCVCGWVGGCGCVGGGGMTWLNPVCSEPRAPVAECVLSVCCCVLRVLVSGPGLALQFALHDLKIALANAPSVHPLFVLCCILYCIVYYKCVCVCVCRPRDGAISMTCESFLHPVPIHDLSVVNKVTKR